VSVTLVTILMMGMFLTGFLLLWQNFNESAITMNDAFRVSAQLERGRSRTALMIEDIAVDTEACSLDVEIVNVGLDPIAPISGMEVIVSFPGGLNDSRLLTYKRNGDGPGLDTWSIKPPHQNDIEPAIARPGSSPVLRLALDLPEIGDTLASVLIATPNGITATTEVGGIITPCSATA